jgi:hypothetical protein
VTGVALTISLAAAAPLPTPAASAGPASLTQTLNADGTVTLNWTAVPGALSYTVTVAETTSAGVAVLPVTTTTIVGTPATTTTPAIAPATTFTTLAALNATSTYVFAVSATTLSGTTVATSTGVQSNAIALPPVAFAGAATLNSAAVAVPGSVTLVWANAAANKNNVAGLTLTWATGAHTFAPTSTGATVTGLPTGSYTFTLQAVSTNAANNSTTVSTAAIAVP